MNIKETVWRKVRNWILTDRERQLTGELDEHKDKVDRVHSEWSELHRAMEHADVIEDGAVINKADILVLTGREHVVRGSQFNGKLYVNGNHHVVTDSHFQTGEG